METLSTDQAAKVLEISAGTLLGWVERFDFPRSFLDLKLSPNALLETSLSRVPSCPLVARRRCRVHRRFVESRIIHAARTTAQSAQPE